MKVQEAIENIYINIKMFAWAEQVTFIYFKIKKVLEKNCWTIFILRKKYWILLSKFRWKVFYIENSFI